MHTGWSDNVLYLSCGAGLRTSTLPCNLRLLFHRRGEESSNFMLWIFGSRAILSNFEAVLPQLSHRDGRSEYLCLRKLPYPSCMNPLPLCYAVYRNEPGSRISFWTPRTSLSLFIEESSLKIIGSILYLFACSWALAYLSCSNHQQIWRPYDTIPSLFCTQHSTLSQA